MRSYRDIMEQDFLKWTLELANQEYAGKIGEVLAESECPECS